MKHCPDKQPCVANCGNDCRRFPAPGQEREPPGIITSKQELADYLRKHDPEFLELIIEARKKFGRLETVAYCKGEK